MSPLDAKVPNALHGGPSFPLRHRLFRLVWKATWGLLASWTPAPFHRWRVWLLNCFGAKVHASAHVYGSVRVWYPPNLVMAERACLGPEVNCYCMATIRLGQGAIVSQDTHLCAGTHDIEHPQFQLVVKPICIGDHAWIAAEAFVGPGVTVGEGAVLGARAVLFKDAQSHGVYVGNPAVLIKRRSLLQ